MYDICNSQINISPLVSKRNVKNVKIIITPKDDLPSRDGYSFHPTQATYNFSINGNSGSDQKEINCRLYSESLGYLSGMWSIFKVTLTHNDSGFKIKTDLTIDGPHTDWVSYNLSCNMDAYFNNIFVYTDFS